MLPLEDARQEAARDGLAEAREHARYARREIDAGRDPIEEREKAKREAACSEMTFVEVTSLYIVAQEDAWCNVKRRARWHSTLKVYAARKLGQMAMGRVR